MYENGMHLGAANLLHLVLSAADRPGFELVQASFVAMCRLRTEEAVNAFFDAASRFEARVSALVGGEVPRVGIILLSRQIAENQLIGPRADPVAPNDLDPAITCMISRIHDWVRVSGPITAEHDDSKEIRRSLETLQLLWKESERLTITLRNGEKLSYPLRVEDFEFATSRDSPRVHAADSIIGGALDVHLPDLGRPDSVLVPELPTLPWDQWQSNASVRPSEEDITPGRPRSAGRTPLPADAMAGWLSRREYPSWCRSSRRLGVASSLRPGDLF